MPLLIIVLLSGLAWLPLSAAAQEPTAFDRPEDIIAPTVVLQGEFALHLAEMLDLPVPEDDMEEAARALAALGIEPERGWMLDYPTTPEIATELRAATVAAAGAGRLAMDADSAADAFGRLLVELELPLPASDLTEYLGGGEYAALAYLPPCQYSAFDRYYDRYGAPLYTYCRPPPGYYDLYIWVPHGFEWHQFHFAGYFILHEVHVISPDSQPGRVVNGLKRKVARDHPPSPSLKQVIADPPAGEGASATPVAPPAPGTGIKSPHRDPGNFIWNGTAPSGTRPPRAGIKGGIGRIVSPSAPPRAIAPPTGPLKQRFRSPGPAQGSVRSPSPPPVAPGPPKVAPPAVAPAGEGDLKRAISESGGTLKR